MEKQFVSFDIALKLKELGFDEKFSLFDSAVYYVNGNLTLCNDGYKTLFLEKEFIICPLYQQVIDWFRIKHNLFIELVIDRTAEPKFTYIITRYLGDFNWEESIMSEFLYRTYEESREDAILKAIELC